ncbi:periplasmic binding protein [Halodesulfurarchaeum formicicum]|uniref:Periplasmic binding protein n=1 Tax=Halodesulfurarchaeum formicicum TaxID=1873524 RepID=A0A1D8S3C8_9EURY|nr:ABC transporter substrate-binding protein [Halodesulfurarchaeum formicicum]AOW79841.1 periplasmic binding protein [Halodesulfurarchaeum formicicum]APE95133.1 periplasmic binding protein [Halodesulfurarchaeum formicicum]
MNRRAFLGGLGTLGAVGLAGCTGSLPGPSALAIDASREILDGAGRSVPLPETVERVIAIGPGALRQIAYFEAIDRVVGVERGEQADFRTLPYNAANPELQDLPIIGPSGPDAAGDAESILAVEPDVVFLSAIGGTGAADRIQAQTGVPTVVLDLPIPLDSGGRERLYDTWRLVGEVLHEPTRAESIIETVSDHVAAIHEQAPERPSTTAYAGGVSYKGAQGLTTTRVPYPPFQFSGAKNVAESVSTDRGSVDIDPERLLQWDPDAIFLSAQNTGLIRDDLSRHPALRSLSALTSGHTFAVPPVSHYHENVGTMLVNAYYVGATLFPDRFGAVDLQSIAASVYGSLLGENPFPEIRQQLSAYERIDLTQRGTDTQS